MSDQTSKLFNILAEAALAVMQSKGAVKDSPLASLGYLLETHSDDIQRYLDDLSKKLQGSHMAEEEKAPAGLEGADDGLPDDERDFVERARQAILTEGDTKGWASGLLTLIDHYHPKSKSLTVEDLLKRYAGGAVPVEELKKVIEK